MTDQNMYTFKQTLQLVLFEVARQQERAADPNNQNVLCIPGVLGPVGSGKTALAHIVAETFDLPMYSVNCGETADATDITGFPLPSEVVRNEHGSYVPWTLNEYMHVACTQPCVLFFDDIDKLPGLVEGALIGLFGKREIKGHKLHPQTILLAAGNRVGDDHLARNLSESLRLRMTPIVMLPSLADFKAYAAAGERRVHPAVLGYLEYKPEHLHAWREDVLRFPCQRSWVEASDLMFAVEEQKNSAIGFNNVVLLKCGEHIAADFGAWYALVRRVNVRQLLLEGDLPDTSDEERLMMQYAAIYALASELNTRGVKKEYVGIATLLEKIQPEMRVAALTQLRPNIRAQLAKLFPKAGGILLQDLVKADTP